MEYHVDPSHHLDTSHHFSQPPPKMLNFERLQVHCFCLKVFINRYLHISIMNKVIDVLILSDKTLFNYIVVHAHNVPFNILNH